MLAWLYSTYDGLLLKCWDVLTFFGLLCSLQAISAVDAVEAGLALTWDSLKCVCAWLAEPGYFWWRGPKLLTDMLWFLLLLQCSFQQQRLFDNSENAFNEAKQTNMVAVAVFGMVLVVNGFVVVSGCGTEVARLAKTLQTPELF